MTMCATKWLCRPNLTFIHFFEADEPKWIIDEKIIMSYVISIKRLDLNSSRYTYLNTFFKMPYFDNALLLQVPI